MAAFNALIFGMGLFFLGMKLIGDNLRGLVGGGFRAAISRTVRWPVMRALLGIGAGALMQSATAVTFICVSMVSTGLLAVSAAAVVILWANVGVTALAFVATLSLHPIVAYLVGGSGIALGTIRVRLVQSFAGVLLGVGLILAGLEQMSAGAAPLKDLTWFQHLLSISGSNPFVGLLVGILIAALLQSNTAAVMMIIALAGAGAMTFTEGVILIYGTNLGAIALRAILSSSFKDDSLRLVRIQDFFCVFSGLLMMTLYFVERAGVPLVEALARYLTDSITTQLAVVFLLSNLLPALLLTPLRHPLSALLKRIWPDSPEKERGKPQFIGSHALYDPDLSIDLLQKEIAHLFSLIAPGIGRPAEEEELSQPNPDFQHLSLAIEDFITRLASRSTLTVAQNRRLQQVRVLLSTVRHVEESFRYFDEAARRVDTPADASNIANLRAALLKLMSVATRAILDRQPEDIATLRTMSKSHGEFIEALRIRPPTPTPSYAAIGVFEDFQVVAWTLRRLAKTLAKPSDPSSPAPSPEKFSLST